MGSIRRSSSPSSGSNRDTAFIQCVDGRDPHIHELWYLGLDNITCKVHPTARLEVISGTVVEFVINYLAENGLRIKITGKLSVNDSVHFGMLLTKPRDMDCHVFATCRLLLKPQGGEVVTIIIRTG